MPVALKLLVAGLDSAGLLSWYREAQSLFTGWLQPDRQTSSVAAQSAQKQGTNHLSPSRLDWESASHHFLHAPLVKAIPCPPGIKSKRKQKGPVDGRSVEEWGAFLILTYSALKHTLLEMLLGASPWLYPYKRVLVSLVQNCKLWNSFPLDLPLSEVTWLRQWIPLIQGRTFTPKRDEISNLFRSWVPRCRYTEEKKKKQQRQEWWCFEWLLGRKNITRLW